jgi:hypothetical protein
MSITFCASPVARVEMRPITARFEKDKIEEGGETKRGSPLSLVDALCSTKWFLQSPCANPTPLIILLPLRPSVPICYPLAALVAAVSNAKSLKL